MAKPPTFTASPPAWITPASARNTPTGRTPAESEYVSITDDQALGSVPKARRDSKGILPALESAHAIAHLDRIAPSLPKDNIIVVNLSGRGDKDCQEVARLIGK